MLKRVAITAAVGLAAIASSPALADSYSMSVLEGLSNGQGFITTPAAEPYTYTPGGNVASASFTYTGALDFNDPAPQNNGPGGDLNSAFGFSTSNISNYGGMGTVTQGGTPIADFSNVASFLASSGSASGFQYGSFYTIDLGTVVAGTVLDITHDDGVSVFQGGNQIGNTVSGPTGKTEDFVTVATTGDTILYYSRQNGTPSILDVVVPEPASVAMFGVSLIGLTMVVRRRRA